MYIYIYIYIDYSLGRPNPRLAVPKQFSRPEAAFSNVFSSGSPSRKSFSSDKPSQKSFFERAAVSRVR